MQKIKKIKDNLNTLALMGLFAASNAIGASINDINNVINEADMAARGTIKIGAGQGFSLWLPIACIVVMMIVGFVLAKKKTQQDQDGAGRIAMYMGGFAILGGLVYFCIVGVCSFVMFQDSTKLFGFISQWWATTLGI